MPHSVWHLDPLFSVPNTETPPGVQAFAFLDTVGPGGGGTVVLAGSHRLHRLGARIGSKRTPTRLKRDKVFGDLFRAEAPCGSCTRRRRIAHRPRLMLSHYIEFIQVIEFIQFIHLIQLMQIINLMN